MRPLGRFIVAILCLLPPLDGCDGGGRGGSSGFDISGENAAIRAALERRACVDFESLNICPAEGRASAKTPTAAPRVNTDLATATSIDCFHAVSGSVSCTYVVRFVAQGFAPGTTFQALARVDAADNPWVLGPDPQVGASDPLSFSTTLVLTATDGGPPARVQFAILAFAGPPPSSTEVGQLHQAEATYAFMTQELAIHVISPPSRSPTPTATSPTWTPTSTPTSIGTNTPGPADCCQCESSCAAPVDGSCGPCAVVFGAFCDPEQWGCAVLPPTPTATATSAPCVNCRPYLYVPVGNDVGNSSVRVFDTTTNQDTGSIGIDFVRPNGIAASPTSPILWVGGFYGYSDPPVEIDVLDIVTNTKIRSFGIRREAFAIAFAPDGATAYVTDLGLNAISVVDVATGNVVASLAGGNQPTAVAATPDGAFVYVVNTCGNGPCFPISRGTISIIDTHGTSITKTVTLGYRSNGIAMSQSGGFALVANQCGEDPQCASEGTLSIIDLETQTVVDDIHITGQFTSNFVAISPDSRFAYVSNTCGSVAGGCSDSYVDGSVSAVDLLTSSVVGPAIPVPGQPLGIAITPDGRTAYVAAEHSERVFAIDTATNSVSAIISIGGHLSSLAIANPPPTPSPTPTATPTATPTPQPTASSGVVGTGTAESCTDAALNAALARFPLVTFDCGGPATIDITNTGAKTIAADTTIDGGNLITISAGRKSGVFIVSAGVQFTVRELMIADGISSGVRGQPAGGGIQNDGTLRVIDSAFTGNGIAIVNSGMLTAANSTFAGNHISISNSGTLTVANSTFTGNDAAYNAAGGTFTLTNSTFTDNGDLNSSGGAINNFGTLNVATSTFTSNNALEGGAINNGGTLGVTDSTFAGNHTAGSCGYIFGGRPSCTGGWGGAIGNTGTLSVANSTFAGNSAARACLETTCSGGGGAIYNAGTAGTLTVLNSSFVGNSASASNIGAAIANAFTCGDAGTAACPATLTNTLVANNPSGGNCAGPITDGGHNLDDGTSCGFSTANRSLSNTDPQLDPAGLQDNGGPTQTVALQADSPAINAGDDAICSAAPVNQLDQRGFTRPGMGHSHCSIGAYELDGAPSGQPTLQFE